ncbi:hypothetical protein [Leucobacter sp. M11]|uniref:hypothetical protein n=1 Tax=Leucobacter sp. M11 TaxID=2993565 RepID=UPI002D7FFA24|nr:hypothetical protein [Leucobacter sp. M11]MEB4616452.1 hypothetical protein [Leucobacter sp. M11]
MSSTNTRIRTPARVEGVATLALVALTILCAMLLGPLWLLAPLLLSAVIVGSCVRKIWQHGPDILLIATTAVNSLVFAFVLTWLIVTGFTGVR